VSRVLLRHDEPLAVVRLGAGAELPGWATSGTLFSVTATAAETSVVCSQAAVPRKARHEGPFTSFSVEGPLDFSLTGVLHDLLAAPAEEEVPVLTLSTFDTDWVLVPADEADRVAEAWRRRGYDVRPADQPTPPSEGTDS
jgi:hypothetical protein